MPRMHLFEWADLAWFPARLRGAMTDFLSFLGGLSERPYVDFVHRLREEMEAAGEQRLVELGSGAGGPLVTIVRMLRERERYPVEAWLTDLHPDPERLERARGSSVAELHAVDRPVDATLVPSDLPGFRLFVNVFHHFDPAHARRVLADAVAGASGVAVYEVNERRWPAFIATLLSPVSLWLTTPFLRPVRIDRLVFTYLLPVLPLAVLWDGVVSCMRTYSPAELRELVEGVASEGWVWEAGRLPLPGPSAHAVYLFGRRVSADR